MSIPKKLLSNSDQMVFPEILRCYYRNMAQRRRDRLLAEGKGHRGKPITCPNKQHFKTVEDYMDEVAMRDPEVARGRTDVHSSR